MSKGDKRRPYDIKKWDENYVRIFGDKRPQGSKTFVDSKAVKTDVTATDTPNGKEIYKIGKELKRMKQLDGKIDYRFEKDIQNLARPKSRIPEIAKKIAEEVARAI